MPDPWLFCLIDNVFMLHGFIIMEGLLLLVHIGSVAAACIEYRTNK